MRDYNHTDAVLQLINDNLAKDPHFYDDPKAYKLPVSILSEKIAEVSKTAPKDIPRFYQRYAIEAPAGLSDYRGYAGRNVFTGSCHSASTGDADNIYKVIRRT